MDSLGTLKDLLCEKIDCCYRSERMKLDQLPELQDRVVSDRLTGLIRDEIGRTQKALERLDRMFEELELSASERPSKVTEGWISDTKRVLNELDGQEVTDSAVAGALLRIDHYNAAGYGAIAAYAELFEHYEVAALSQESLEAMKKAGEELRDFVEKELDPLALPNEEA